MGDSTRVLVVEDDEGIAELLQYNIEREGMFVVVTRNGRDALQQLQTQKFDVVLLDLMLPGVSGLDICRHIKEQFKKEDPSIMMITAKNTEADIVAGLELGADDYMTKPFSPREVIARVRALLRRKKGVLKAQTTEVVTYRNLKMDLKRHRVTLDEEEIDLTSTEFKLLKALLEEPGRVYSRDRLIKIALGDNVSVVARTIDVHITNLRKKLGTFAQEIENIRGVGYRLKDV